MQFANIIAALALAMTATAAPGFEVVRRNSGGSSSTSTCNGGTSSCCSQGTTALGVPILNCVVTAANCVGSSSSKCCTTKSSNEGYSFISLLDGACVQIL